MFNLLVIRDMPSLCNEIHFTYIILVNVKVLKYQDLMKM